MSPEAAAVKTFPDSVARVCAALGPDIPDATALRAALNRLDWVMALPNGAAPSFVYLAGACGGAPVGGGGGDLVGAARRLAGEASEVLAQQATPEPGDAPADPGIAAVWGDGPRIAANNLTQGRSVGVPMAAIFPAFAAASDAPPRSLGLAAGPNRTAARLAGVLELVERDAAAAWWNGETRPRAIGLAEVAPAVAELARMRAGAVKPGRPTTFLALPSITGLPVLCAMSRDAEGCGLVFGLKAALDLRAAAVGAMFELLQMEVALEIARLREAQGRPAPGDAGPLARAALDPDGFDAFAPLPPRASAGLAVAGLDDLVAHLAGRGMEVIVADLAGVRGEIAVAKAFVPGLRPLPGPGARPRQDAPGASAALM